MKKLLIFCAMFFVVGQAWSYPVYYNKKSKIYHDMNCEWAHKCTVNCIKIDHTDAIHRGGRACGVCGG